MATFIQQFRKLWDELGTNQKVTIMLGLFGLLVVMAVMTYLSMRPNMQLLYRDLEQQSMAEVTEFLKTNSVDYRLDEATGSIYVNKADPAELRMQLSTQGIGTSGSEKGYEIFDESNFGISDFVQKTNKQRALEGELARSIRTIKNVNSAAVRINRPDNRLLLSDNKDKPTASVMVDTGNRTLEDFQVTGIRVLIAGAVEGLSADDVDVVDNKGRALSEGLLGNDDAGNAVSHLELRKKYETYFYSKLVNQLAPVIGDNNFRAQVAVDVTTETEYKETETFDPESVVARVETKEEEKEERMEREIGPPVVGVEPNVPGGVGTDQGEIVGNESRSRKRTENTNEISKEYRELTRRPGDINAITASIVLNLLPATEAGGTPQPRSEQQIEDIRLLAAGALGLDANTNAITVRQMEFTPTLPPEQNVVVEIMHMIGQWFRLYGNLVAVLLAVVLFIVFLVMLKRYRPVKLIPETPAGGGGELVRSRDTSPKPTPDLLNDLIQQKPENVSTALKNWMDSASTK